MNFKDIVDNFSKQLFISSAMAFLCGLTQFFLSHFERSAKILRKIAVNGEKCATDSIYKGFKCGTIAGSPECWWVTTKPAFKLSLTTLIARSPECWWVTTYCASAFTSKVWIAGAPECWWVTTSQLLQCILLQLFCLQNVGSLRNCNDCVHPIISRYESTQ